MMNLLRHLAMIPWKIVIDSGDFHSGRPSSKLAPPRPYHDSTRNSPRTLRTTAELLVCASMISYLRIYAKQTKAIDTGQRNFSTKSASDFAGGKKFHSISTALCCGNSVRKQRERECGGESDSVVCDVVIRNLQRSLSPVLCPSVAFADLNALQHHPTPAPHSRSFFSSFSRSGCVRGKRFFFASLILVQFRSAQRCDQSCLSLGNLPLIIAV
jgi:hypothetical protein